MVRPLIAVLFVLSCTPKTSEAPALGAVEVAAPVAPALPEVERSDEELYGYSPVGKPDPFRPFLQPAPPPKRGSKLLRWELDQLKLVAVVTGETSPYAMVEDPKGRGHVIRRGDLIGKNYGRVTRIEERAVTIREDRHDPLGRRISHTQSMTIPRLPLPHEEDDDDVIDG